MMSDHWKLLANILGTPGPAEPVAKETPKKKPETENSAEKLAPAENASDSSRNEVAPKRDPLADIVDRQPDPIVPGFVIPEPVATVEKPAKRSAWDTLIGSLGIKTAPEPEADIVKPVSHSISPKPVVERASMTEKTLRSHSTSADEPNRGSRSRSGFGSGLTDEQEPDSWDNSSPTSSGETSTNEARRPRRDESTRESSSSSRPARDDRHEGPRSGNARRDERPASRGEERPPRSRDRGPAPRSEEVDEVRRPAGRNFADGLIDWDDADDDASLFVEPDSGEAGEFDEPFIERTNQEKDTQGRSREENDRPRGRGRRGGSRNRGRDDSQRENPLVSDVEDDVIGWDAEPVDDAVESDVTARGRSPRGDQPRRDVESRDVPRREERGRGGSSRPDSLRSESSRSESRRSETIRHEPSRDSKPLPERSDSEESSSAGSSRRRGRRGQRQQMGAPDSEPRIRRESSARNPEDDFVEDDLLLEDDDTSSPGITAQSSIEAKEAPTRSRRRRGRRGRGGAGRDREDKVSTGPDSRPKETDDRDLDDDEPFVAELEPFDSEQEPFAAELSPDLIDEVMLDDDHEDDEEAERIRRNRRRGRGGRGESRPRGDAAESTDDSVEPATSSSAAPNHRNVPTWLDTVSLLVDSNIERHRRSGPPRAPQGRGGRR